MPLRQFLLVVLFMTIAPFSFAQHFSLSRLFYPNMTLSTQYNVPAPVKDGADFGLTRTGFFGMTPIQSEVQLGYSLRKKLDLRAVHTLMYAQYDQLKPTIDGENIPEHGYKTLSVGVIRLQASIKDKLWVYGGGIGITETNETFFSPQPFFWGGGARMHILGLRTQIIYGSILAYNQKLMFVPIFGLNKGLGKHWRVSALLPFMINGNYRVTKWFNVDMLTGLSGYSGGFQVQTPEEKLLRRQNFHQIKSGLSANLHLFSVLNLSVETGITTFRKVKILNGARENLDTYSPAASPYVGVSVRYITSRGKLSSKFVRKMGLGEPGFNW